MWHRKCTDLSIFILSSLLTLTLTSQAVLSDGKNSIEVVISTHLSHLVQSGQLEEHTIVKVKTYQYNITDDNIHIVSISEVVSRLDCLQCWTSYMTNDVPISHFLRIS